MLDNLYVFNVEGAVTRQGRYLLIVRGDEEEHAAGTLSLVGGGVDKGVGELRDVIEVTLRREIREEVGLEIGELAYVSSNAFLTSQGDPVIDIVFLCQYVGGEPTISDPGEVASTHWLTAVEVEAWPGVPPWTLASISRVEAVRVKLGW